MLTIKKYKSKLTDLVNRSNGIVEFVSHEIDMEILSVEYDSRKVKNGSLFVAVEGFESDGHKFITKAVDNGAVAVVVSRKKVSDYQYLLDNGISLIVSDNTRRALSIISAAFYQFPARHMTVIGITGTNGKTSITYMMESILKTYGMKPGVIGTVNYRWNEVEITASNTTPESKDIHEMLYDMRKDGVDIVIMEVSSHALELNRVDDIDFDVAVFTNLTRDHLDFHKNFDEYFNAKKKIFQLLEDSSKIKRAGVINIDDEYGVKIGLDRDIYSYLIVDFGLSENAFFKPEPDSVNNSINGLSYRMEKPEKGAEVKLNVSGRFHVYNSLAAIAALYMIEIPFEDIQKGFINLTRVPGRFDVVNSDAGYSVVVDYAHTSDALVKLLESVNELDSNRVITVFGCGGDRDKTKRPVMGKAAVENSDYAIVTSDNPRTEDPDLIIKDIVADLKGSNFEIVPDREEAIKKAIFMAEKDDIIVIAGKGHEDYQILGKKKIHFDDREMASKYIKERKAQ